MSPEPGKSAARRSRNGIYLPQLPKRLDPAGPEMIADHTQLLQVLLAEIDLTGLQAANLLLEQVGCRRVILVKSHFSGLRLFDSRLESCDLAGARWEKARLRRVELLGCRLLGADLAEASCEDVLFRDCHGEKATFVAASFRAARFEKCNLQGASFEGADLSGVVFQECDLAGADLRGARLKDADFRRANLNGVQAGIKELQGAIIAPIQAIQVVGLLGLVVKELEEPE